VKILFFSSYDKHGAGVAAYRIFQGLRNKGFNADFMTKYKSKCDSIQIENRIFENMAYRVYSDNISKACVGEPIGIMALGLPEKELAELSAGYDIINFHWVNYFISIQGIFAVAQTGKPIVITMHDENLYTGGCHYTGGCDGYLYNCENCPKLDTKMHKYPPLELANKMQYVPKDAIIVTPSRWLAERARRSKILSNNRIEVIPNGIDVNIYNPKKRQEQRNKLNLLDDEKMLLFGAQSINDKRKGAQFIPDVLTQLRKRDFKFKAFAFGETSVNSIEEVYYLGVIDDEHHLAKLYAAADTLLLPSLEDNLPNVMLESLLCGTPVAAFDAGGISDAIIHNKNGMLAQIGNAKELANMVIQISQEPSMRSFCRDDAVKRYSLEEAVSNYTSLFENIITETRYERLFEPNALIYTITDDLEEYYEESFKERINNYQESLNVWCSEWSKEWSKSEFCRLEKSVRRLRDAAKEGKTVVIYGMGQYGRFIYTCTQDYVDFCVDGNPDNCFGNTHRPEKLQEYDKDNLYILIAINGQVTQVEEILNNYGLVKGEQYENINDLF